VDTIVLVDDSVEKRVEGENFIRISVFNGENQNDDALLALIAEL
jgi:hypothetical protein